LVQSGNDNVTEQHARHGYWRSLAELADTPEFRAQLEPQFREAGQPYLSTEAAGDVDRRRWFQIVAASAVLASAAGCRWEREEIVPLTKRPDRRVPGEPYRVATTMDLAGDPIGLLVTCVDGRPIKVEGNPLHPQSGGGTHVFAQAATLELYDPDRSRDPVERTAQGDEVRDWDRARAMLRARFEALRAAEGAGLVIVAGASASPTLAHLRSQLRRAMPRMRWFQHEPLGPWAQAVARYDLDQAEIIVSLGADVFGVSRDSVRLTRQFASRRDPAAGKMNRLYVVESGLTVTGAAADHRIAIAPSDLPKFVERLSRLVESPRGHGSGGGTAGDSSSSAAWERAASVIADDLRSHAGRCVVIGPDDPVLLPQVARINQALGVIGRTVRYFAAMPDDVQRLTDADLDEPAHTLLILGGNPVYDAPCDCNIAAMIEAADCSIHLSLYRNETSRLCNWHLPQAHFLEAWGDARTLDGMYSVAQPTIEPLYGGWSAIELLAVGLGLEETSGRQLVRAQFVRLFGESDWERRWRKALHDGVFAEKRLPLSPEVALAALASGGAEARQQAQEQESEPQQSAAEHRVEVVFAPGDGVYDGRFANNAWLQEFPQPITRLTWGNAAVMSPASAETIGVRDGDVVRLSARGNELELPVCLVPGVADGAVVVALGYGRTEAGRVGGSESGGIASVGANVYRLRTAEEPWSLKGVGVYKASRREPLATVQDHFPIDTTGFKARTGRAPVLVRQADLEEYRKHPDFARHQVHVPHQESLWKEPEYRGYRWAMTVDLSKCVGCGACVVACQAENNIPVVGKEQVIRGREMHWMRIDRYYAGPADQPVVAFQPMLCQQCELAPCEGVCPVNATVHSSEGLNDMVYNRCVGTRYCGNNCPYKVRRFNYFNYHKHLADARNEVLKMGANPEVTVRSRGVMEKCTYCVQRIQAAKIKAKNAGEAVRDGAIATACQQACPAGAIVFGDLGPAEGPPRTAVARQFADPRTYELLAELNHKARTRYMARIRNPNPSWGTG